MNVASLLEKCAQRYGALTALRDLDTGHELTFLALHDSLARVAVGLEAAGILIGERVALLGGADSTYLLCDYGVMAAGRARVPLDPGLSADEQRAQLDNADVRLLIHSPAQAQRAAELSKLLPTLLVASQQAILDQATPPHSVAMAPAADVIASLSYTGGTTGSPKAVIVTHGSLTAAVQNIAGARAMRQGDVMLNVRPTWPIAAVVLLAHLAIGGTVVLGEGFDPRGFLQRLADLRVAATSLVPTHLVRLLNECDPSTYDLSHLRTVDVGAAAIPAELFTRLLAALGPRIGVLYGLTEAPWSCYLPPSSFDAPPEIQQQRMRCVGRALFGVEICAQSAEGLRLPADEEGEITIRGAHVLAGYWRRPDADAAALRNGWFHTGDLGTVDSEGYVRITGRIKDVVRTGGRSVVPAEVEGALLQHAAVAEAVVVGLPDSEWGEVVAAAVVLHADRSEDPSERELIEWCRNRLSSFKKPKHVVVVNEIPRSHYGKPLRARLREQLMAVVAP